MPINNECAGLLLRILSMGLLRICSYATDGRVKECELEADHLHNLPTIIASGRLDQLEHYFNAERPAFLLRAEHAAMFEAE